MARLLTRSDTCSLDPVGARLALDGRLSSGESREGLTGALRQASQQSAELQQATAAGAEDGSSGAATTAPTLLSSRAHQLPAELLDAFQGVEEQELDACSPSDSGNSTSTTAPDLSAMREHRGSKSSGGVPLSQQDSLMHPPLPVNRTRSQPGGSSSGISAGAPSSSPPQRLPVTAAIERTSTAMLDANGGVDHGVGMHDPTCTCPPYAVKSTCGKRPNMEDTYALCPNICELPMSPMVHDYADKLPHRIAVQFENHCMHMPVSDGQQLQQQQQPPPLNGASSPSAAAVNGVPAAAEHNTAQQQHHHAHHQQQQQQQQQFGQLPATTQRRKSHAPEALASAQPQQPDPLQPAAAAAAGRALQGLDDSAAVFAGSASLVPAPLPAAHNAEHSVSSFSSSDGGSVEKLHFFGVYDGHGGIEASQHCAQRLHYHLSKAVAELANGWLGSSAGDDAAGSWNPEVKYVPLDTARVGDSGSPGECRLAATAAGEDAEAGTAAGTSGSGGAAQSMSSSGSSGSGSELGRSVSQASSGNGGGSGSSGDCEVDSNEGSAEGSEGTATSFCGLMEEVLRDAFLKTDEEFSNSGLQAGLVGSTAVVALVGTHRVWIANCGDSRAVLSRAGVAVQVTDDHKPEREDEAERVEKAGGQVLYWNGHRVMGVLAMSRAIGDHCLRPYVIPEPEISVFARHPRDEILLLASDGLWDVLSNQDATDLALRSIKRAREKGASRKAAARVAATVLTKAAVDRGSRDNITVVIIDLAPTPGGGEQQRQCGDKAAMAAVANGPLLPDSGGDQPQAVCGADADADANANAGGLAAGGSGSRPSSGGSSKGVGRAGSVKGSGSGSNPFAAAAVSPFSTAATGSSELPLPSGASGSGNAAGNEVLAAVGSTTAGSMQAAERSGRSSVGSGRMRGSGTGYASGASSSAFAAASGSASGRCSTDGNRQQSETQRLALQQGSATLLTDELDSIDISGMGAAAACRGGGRLPSIDSMARASSAAECSNASSLEQQPTLVEPPPALARQASSSPFSAFQGSTPFSDGGAEAVC